MEIKTNRRFFAILGIVLSLGAVVLTGVFRDLGASRQRFLYQATLAREQAKQLSAQVVVYSEKRIAAGLTFSQTLGNLGVQPVQTAGIIDSVQGIFDLRHIRAGNLLEIGRSVEGELRAVRYQIDSDRMLDVHPGEHGFEANVEQIPSRTVTATVRGEIHDSLFNAIERAGESPELAMRLAEIFGWDLDFYTDPRQGDTFRVVVEKKTYRNGSANVYGRILAAEYKNAGHSYQAVLFHDASGAPGYYAADGSSLQKAFLRSPLKFAAPITSHFSQSRLHPILKVYRPHLGIDYAAPTGTPVQAIGGGQVVFAGFKGEDGNMVHIKHANGYETMYMHLSRILVRAGQHVQPGDGIGLVGMTGLATGPHLDFRISEHGSFMNFETLRLRLPPSEPVATSDRAEFAAARDRAIEQLDDATFDARATSAPAALSAVAASQPR